MAKSYGTRKKSSFSQKKTKLREMEELEESFKRLEGIIIQLINQQKLMQIEQKGIEKSFNAIVKIISKLMKEK